MHVTLEPESKSIVGAMKALQEKVKMLEDENSQLRSSNSQYLSQLRDAKNNSSRASTQMSIDAELSLRETIDKLTEENKKLAEDIEMVRQEKKILLAQIQAIEKEKMFHIDNYTQEIECYKTEINNLNTTILNLKAQSVADVNDLNEKYKKVVLKLEKVKVKRRQEVMYYKKKFAHIERETALALKEKDRQIALLGRKNSELNIQKEKSKFIASKLRDEIKSISDKDIENRPPSTSRGRSKSRSKSPVLRSLTNSRISSNPLSHRNSMLYEESLEEISNMIVNLEKSQAEYRHRYSTLSKYSSASTADLQRLRELMESNDYRLQQAKRIQDDLIRKRVYED